MPRNKERQPDKTTFWRNVLLVFLGAAIGVLCNQAFFWMNKDYESQRELQKELMKEQYPYLNRIMLFAEVTLMAKPLHIIDMKDEGVVSPKEGGYNHRRVMPSFVIDSNSRRIFHEDMAFIEENRVKIDHEIYKKFEKVLSFLMNHNLPEIEYDAIERSPWNDSKTIDDWKKIVGDLHNFTHKKVKLIL